MPGSMIPEDIMIPTHEDENNSIENVLYGRNEAKGAVVLGWTNNILLDLNEPKEDLRLKTHSLEEILSLIKFYKYNDEEGLLEYVDGTGQLPTLAERSRGARYSQCKIIQPLLVTVVEKKCSFTLKGPESTKVICKIIVSDDSGFLFLSCFNDAVDSLYKQVNIGDRLVICQGQMKVHDVNEKQRSKQVTEKDSIFLNCKKFINDVEIKINMYETRGIYRIKSQYRYNQIPESFGILPQKGLWSPNELFMKDSEVYKFPVGVTSINLCGVISYVGRISRVEIHREEKSQIVYYSCFRWIQLIDKEVKKPLSLKLWLNDITWSQQKEIVPGSAVIITNVHCDTREEFWDFHLVSTPFTKMYVNKRITDFLGMLPKQTKLCAECLEEIRNISQPNKATAILSRREISWMVGGTLHMKITDVDKFIKFYKEAWESYCKEVQEDEKKLCKMIQLNIPPFNKTVDCPQHLKDIPLARREEQRLYIKGFIYKMFVLFFTGDIIRKFDWALSPEQLKSRSMQRNIPDDRKFDVRRPPLWSLRHDDPNNWFSFRRKLPQENTIKVLDGVFKNLKESSEQYSKYCAGLLMPSDSHSASKLKELPLAEEEACFEIFIADTNTGRNYHCRWNTYSFEAMKARLHVMKSKEEIKPHEYVFVLNVHRIENPIPKKNNDGKEFIQEFLDVQLIDFVEYNETDPED